MDPSNVAIATAGGLYATWKYLDWKYQVRAGRENRREIIGVCGKTPFKQKMQDGCGMDKKMDKKWIRNG